MVCLCSVHGGPVEVSINQTAEDSPIIEDYY
jgi:hypothetical protein